MSFFVQRFLLNVESEDNRCCVVQPIHRFIQDDRETLFHPQFLSGYFSKIFNHRYSLKKSRI